MARKAREKSKSGKYIVMLKGVEDTIFKSKKTQEAFKELVENAFGKGMLGIRFFNDSVIMALKETKAGIGMDMKPVLISFARTLNRNNGEAGKVFADRFKSIPLDDKDFEAECMGYINRENTKDPFAAKRAVAPRATEPKPKATTKKPAAKKATPKKTESDVVTKKVTPPTPAPEKVEVKKEEPKKRNNLPTWLL